MDSKAFLDAVTYSKNHRLVKEIIHDATNKYFQSAKLPQEKSSTSLIEPNYKMLDLGCGTCENTKWFGEKIGATLITAIDWNPNFLKFATEHEQKSKENAPDQPQLELLSVDLNQLHWHEHVPSMDYDIITSFLTLHWIKNLTNCLESLKCLMKPSKTFMFHVIGIKPGPNFQATMKDLATTEKWGPIIKEFAHSTRWQDPNIADWRCAPDPAAAFADILTSAGFSVSLCQRMAFTYTTESEAECRGHLTWLVPFTWQLAESERDCLMTDFMAAYSRHTKQPEPGRYVWENEVLVVLAQRAAVELHRPAGGGQ